MRAACLCCLLACLAAGDALVERAELDPTQAVPLLLAGSAELAAANGPDARNLADRLDSLARRIFLGGWRVAGRERLGFGTHAIAAGDTLSKIAVQAGTPYELLIRLNPGLDPRRLGVGARVAVLDVATVPLTIDIRLPIHRLLVWRGPVLVLACPMGIGTAKTPTPTGRTRLAIRARNIEWRDPATGRVHPHGSPGNHIGGYWFGFDPGPGHHFRSIGFHGWTAAPPEQWLEQAGSLGCLRLRQSDLADLYDLLRPGTIIDIR